MNTAETIHHELNDFVSFICKLGEMSDQEFDYEFHSRLLLIETLSQQIPTERDVLMKELFDRTGEFEQGIMYRHSRTKPLGYPGDHVMIDMIYDRRADSPGKGKLLDEFFHRQPSPQAVRNRKSFFVETFTELCQETQAPAVLDIACGPCRDVVEAIRLAGDSAHRCHFHCADMDQNAIAYAQNVVAECIDALQSVSFKWEAANAFRMRPGRTYNLTWSAGLFDYLDERTAALLLKKMWSWTDIGGELIVGNFHVSNPDRPWMEWCGDWRLIHRTEEDMLRLCNKASIPLAAAQFHFEPLGVNMFLRVRKG